MNIMKPQRLIFVAAAIACLLVGLGLSVRWMLQPLPTTTISAGMPMVNALSEMEHRGLESAQMQFADPHHAFDLPDGRAMVLFGDQRVDKIQIITNPATSKGTRALAIVPTITF